MVTPYFDPNYWWLGGGNWKLDHDDAGYCLHPAANLMPYMSNVDRDHLNASIVDHGLRDPIVVCKGLVLDGRHRFTYFVQSPRHKGSTLEELRGTLKTVDGRDAFIDVDMSDSEAVRYVLDKNLSRRHLTQGQKAAISADLATMSKVDAGEKGNAAQGKKTRNSQSTVASIPKVTVAEAATKTGASTASVTRAKKAAISADLATMSKADAGKKGGKSFSPKIGKTPAEGSKGKDALASIPKVTVAEAAAKTGASERSVKSAKKVKAADPALHEQVKQGDVTLNEAVKQVTKKTTPKKKAKPEPTLDDLVAKALTPLYAKHDKGDIALAVNVFLSEQARK